MNDQDKLYLELGAKDNLSPIIDKLVKDSEKLQENFDNFRKITIKDITLKDGALNSIKEQIQDSLNAEPFTISVAPDIDTTRVTEAARSIIEAQEKIINAAKGTTVEAGTSSSGTESATNTATQAARENAEAVQQQAKSYEELRAQVDAVLGSLEKNTATVVEKRNAISLIDKEMKAINKAVEKSGSMTENQRKRLQQLTAAREQHKQTLQTSTRTLQNDIKLAQASTGSMNELNQSLGRMRMAYRAMTEEQRNSDFGKELLLSIQKADSKIKELDATIGNHQRNVGNYLGRSYNGLNMSLQQIVRELPNASLGFGMFTLAISNNIPILADQIKMAKEAAKAQKEMGQTTTPVWKQLLSSLFSWQSALVLGVTLLTVYGKEIGEWAKGLFTGGRAAISAADATEKLNEQLEKNDGKFSDNAISIKRLASEWKELKNEAEKTAWIEANQSAFDAMGLSIRDVTSAERAFVEYTPAVIEALKSRARAEAARELAQNKYKEAFLKREKARQEQSKGVSWTDRMAGSMAQISTTGTGNFSVNQQGATPEDIAKGRHEKRVKDLETEADTLEKEVNVYYDIVQLEDEKAKAELKRLGIYKERNKTAKEQLQAQKANLQAQLDILSEAEAAGEKGEQLRKKIQDLDKRLEAYSNKKTDHNKGNKNDEQLEALKNRINLYKKFYQELQGYKIVYSENEALDILNKDGEFNEVFNWKEIKNITNYKQSIDDLTAEFDANTLARQKFIDSTKADIENKQRKEATDSIKVYVSELQKMSSVMSENYKTYRKWLELTGDEALAARVAGVTQNTTYSDYLRGKMQEELSKNRKFSALTPYDVLGLSAKDIQKFGKESSIFAIWEEWRKNQNQLKKEQWELYAEAIKNAKTYEDKIADINRQLEKEIEAIEAMGGDENLIRNARKNAEKQISSIQWEKFKEENNWGEVFGDIGSMPLNRIKKMVSAMQDLAETTDLNVVETKAWYEAMEKLMNQEAVLNPIQAISSAIKNYDLTGKKIGELEMRREAIRRGYDTSMTESELDKSIDELKVSQAKSLRDLQKAIKALSNNITSLGNSFETLGNSIGGTFGDVLNGFGTIFGGLGKSMDAITSVDVNAEGIAAVAGEVGAVVAVFSAMIDMNKKLHELLPSTESLYEYYAEKQREINKAREAIDDYAVAVIKSAQQEKDWLYKNELTDIRNGGYVQGKLLENYLNTALAPQVIYEESRSGLSKWAGAIIGAIVGAVITIVTWGSGGPLGVAAGTAIANVIGGVAATAVGAAVATGAGAAIGQAMQSAAEQIFYKEGYTSARANMRIQHHHASFWRSEETQNLEEWVREEYGKELFGWNFHGYNLIDLDIAKSILDRDITLAGETKETLERLVELTEQIKEVQDQAHQYVSDRFSPLVDNMTDSLWDWLKDGTNMLRSFRDYASDTFSEIAKDAIKAFLKINLMDKFTTPLNDMFEAYSFGLIDETALMLGVANVAGQIGETFATLTPTLQEMGNVLAEAFRLEGYDIVNGTDGSSSSTTSTIRSVTEGTADLIAGYINAIRADTSVNRETLNQLLGVVQGLGGMPTLAQAQLREMQQITLNTNLIADFTRQNAQYAADIRDQLKRFSTGAEKIYIK